MSHLRNVVCSLPSPELLSVCAHLVTAGLKVSRRYDAKKRSAIAGRQRTGADEAHPSIGVPYPVLASIACTSAGRAKGSGAGSPDWRRRPIAAKKSSKPGGRKVQGLFGPS